MSRVGKKPVAIPSGVTAAVEGQAVKIKGAKGELRFVVPDDVSVVLEKGAIKVDPRSPSKQARALWGTSRARIANLVEGVTKLSRLELQSDRLARLVSCIGQILSPCRIPPCCKPDGCVELCLAWPASSTSGDNAPVSLRFRDGIWLFHAERQSLRRQ